MFENYIVLYQCRFTGGGLRSKPFFCDFSIVHKAYREAKAFMNTLVSSDHLEPKDFSDYYEYARMELDSEDFMKNIETFVINARGQAPRIDTMFFESFMTLNKRGKGYRGPRFVAPPETYKQGYRNIPVFRIIDAITNPDKKLFSKVISVKDLTKLILKYQFGPYLDNTFLYHKEQALTTVHLIDCDNADSTETSWGKFLSDLYEGDRHNLDGSFTATVILREEDDPEEEDTIKNFTGLIFDLLSCGNSDFTLRLIKSYC